MKQPGFHGMSAKGFEGCSFVFVEELPPANLPTGLWRLGFSVILPKKWWWIATFRRIKGRNII